MEIIVLLLHIITDVTDKSVTTENLLGPSNFHVKLKIIILPNYVIQLLDKPYNPLNLVLM